ncbi:hypothetical protein Bhyg_05337, partial [Pseudolycoriella hygida]
LVLSTDPISAIEVKRTDECLIREDDYHPTLEVTLNIPIPANCICFHEAQRLFCGTTKGSVYLYDLQTNRSPLHFALGSVNVPMAVINDDF